MNNMYDALLLVSFGGPESIDEIKPFLERITEGKNIPSDRLEEIAQRYKTVGGVSPLNANIRNIKKNLEIEIKDRDIDIPIFIGHRNVEPLIVNTVNEMKESGVARCLAWLSSPYSSYSSCRQYTENVENACSQVGIDAPQVEQIRRHHDHPGLIEPAADCLRLAIEDIPDERRNEVALLFSAHSLPMSMAQTCRYEAEINEAALLVANKVDPDKCLRREVVWQSRSGPPSVPWLEPDINDKLEQLASEGVKAVAVSPIGFPVENFEILWDLDLEASNTASSLDMSFSRAETVNNDPRFISMIADLLCERTSRPTLAAASLGALNTSPEKCEKDCCPN
ncbi:MAG: ferrochelatase [Acidimicrobiales bacterium]